MIEIEFSGLEPPEGCVRLSGVPTGDRATVDFAGWTGLIQAIMQLVVPDGSARASSDLPGELRARRHFELPEDVPQVGSNGPS